MKEGLGLRIGYVESSERIGRILAGTLPPAHLAPQKNVNSSKFGL
jgi:hypothetical protein